MHKILNVCEDILEKKGRRDNSHKKKKKTPQSMSGSRFQFGGTR